MITPEDICTALEGHLEGEVLGDLSSRLIYATDASVYRELPIAVAYPKHSRDLKVLIDFARHNHLSLIPRTAGTSLAGQVVGNGIVVDVSRHFKQILDINIEERWVKVQPGVVLDELNKTLAPHGLFFAPETSTANRCMIGGMVGNNSCGAHSLIYGSTRDHVLAIECLLSDGSEACFEAIRPSTFEEKCKDDGLEGRIYKHIQELLSSETNRREIIENYPDPALHRRNTGYALDLLASCKPFASDGQDFNFCKLLTGSEGTLAFTTAIKLNLLPLPPAVTGLLCVHFASLEDALHANLIALQHQPGSIELMDRVIMNCTRDNLSQRNNRFFIQGEPEAILMIEWARETKEEIVKLAGATEHAMRAAGLGIHFPLIFGPDQKKAWDLRKAGLGVLTNVPGDAKPTGLIEDTAVLPSQLPEYIREFKLILDKYGLSCVYYAHIATGELHLKPVLNLKTRDDHSLFKAVALETATLVKKYRGSLSGEHGDGRLRGQFIPLMLGERVYQWLCELKEVWDPENIFNAGKITATPPMDTNLRYEPGQSTKDLPTFFDFSATVGLQRALEQCNGSADCRKSATIGGVMCPSYMASGDEYKTTRARANLMREMLNRCSVNEFYKSREVYEILAECLSCKGCKSECPSGIDMAKYKAEFLQHYYDAHGTPMRTRLFAGIKSTYALFSSIPWLFNAFANGGLLKMSMGLAPERHLPKLSKTTLVKWFRNEPANTAGRTLILYADEFTNYTDVHIGIAAVNLLCSLGYNVKLSKCMQSGRAQFSKGLLRKAKGIAEKNVTHFSELVNENCPLVGLEPSALMCFRDEYPDLVASEQKASAKELARHCFTFDEFIAQEFKSGNIEQSMFTEEKKVIRFHGHCYQKASSGTSYTKDILSIPRNYNVSEINSGCCGMAGSFGFEKEHYELSMQIGELKLFPTVRESAQETMIVAAGTSCRQHIGEGTGRTALHPAEVLYLSLKPNLNK